MISIQRDDEEQGNGDEEGDAPAAAPLKKASAWAKPKKGKGGKGGKKPVNQKKRAPAPPPKATVNAASNADPQQTSEADSDADASDIDDKDSESVSGEEGEKNKNNSSLDDDDDEEWEKLQAKLNKREKLEGKSRISHAVHCPYFPEVKQEYWWTYICDRKSRTLLTAPFHVTNLVEREEIQLKFTAPRWPGVYTFTVCLRSGMKFPSI